MNAALAVLLSLVAHNPSPLPPPAPLEVTGKIREVISGMGVKPQAILALDDKKELVLHGHSEADDVELIRLAGVRVKIDGIKGDPLLPRGNHVRVLRYEILDVGGGVVPRLGRLALIELNGAERVLFVDDEGRADLLPAGFTAKMSKNAGARVWMIGTKEKSELVPTRFAILRDGVRDGKGVEQ
jgi:hypothetical protein